MTEIILGVIAIVTAPLAAWLTSRLLKAKYTQEVEKLKAEVQQMKSDVRSRELDNDRKSIEMVMELVVEPLRKEMKSLQRKIDRFTNAVEQIPSCPHSANCPVSRELQREPEFDQPIPEPEGNKTSGRRSRKAGGKHPFRQKGNPSAGLVVCPEDGPFGDGECGDGHGDF